MSLDACSDIQNAFQLVCYCINRIGYELQILCFENGRKRRKERKEQGGREGERERWRWREGGRWRGKVTRIGREVFQLMFRPVS